jgi:hypothetical protein
VVSKLSESHSKKLIDLKFKHVDARPRIGKWVHKITVILQQNPIKIKNGRTLMKNADWRFKEQPKELNAFTLHQFVSHDPFFRG